MSKRLLYPLYRRLTLINGRAKRRFTPAGALAGWGAVAAAAIGIDTTYTMAYQGLALLASLLGLSALWSFVSRTRFSGRRQLPRLGTVGQPLPYGIELRNLTKRPVRGMVLEESFPEAAPSRAEFLAQEEPGENSRNAFDRACGYYRWRYLTHRCRLATCKRLQLPPVEPGGTRMLRHELVPLRRGNLRLSGFILSWPDPLGFFRALHRVSCPQTVLILPRRYPIPRLELPGNRRHQPAGVALASSVGESEEFTGLRDYRPGDPVRRIHWRSLARTGKPIVKEFQDEFFVRHALVLDTFPEPGCADLFEDAISVAASFACTIPNQESLLDLLFVAPEAFTFTAGRSLGGSQQMLEMLAAVSASETDPCVDLESLVLRHAPVVTSCVFVLLGWDESRRRLVHQVRQLGVPVLALVLVPNDHPGNLDAGPMADDPSSLHVIPQGRVAECLARL